MQDSYSKNNNNNAKYNLKKILLKNKNKIKKESKNLSQNFSI